MKTRSLLAAMICSAGLASVASAQMVNPPVSISAVYGGGGNGGATFRYDFVELHNRTAAAIDLSGWSIQYSSATGVPTSFTNLSGIIPANGYFLVRQASGANTTLAWPVTEDFVGTIGMAGSAAKVYLVNSTTALTGTCPTASPTLVDFVGWGSANCAEGTAAAATTNPTGLVRADNGCADTNNNSVDFAVVAMDGVTFTPRNSASPAYSCGGSIVDCNNNTIDDAIEIAGNPALDCNTDGTIDSCQLTGNDCNSNSVLDSCDITANPALDCNTDGIIDSCQLAANDCNSNSVLDSCDIAANPALDADSNGFIDSCEGSSLASVIISEVVDGTLTSGLPKYVEITNLSAVDTVTFGINDSIKLYSNGSSTAGQTYSLNGLSLSPGQSYVIANDGGGTTLPPAAWVQAYGPFNLPNAYGSPSFINGNDALTIERNGTIIDSFGAVGTDGTGTAWDYMDSYARRKPGICASSGTFSTADWIFGGPNALEQTLLNQPVTNTDAVTLYIANLKHLTTPGTHANTCAGRTNDCNTNGIDDSVDIAGGTPDCNANGVPDSCDIANGALDCNSNGIPDNCDILSGAFPDANATGIPDMCDAFQSDCNANFIEDADEIANGAPDCNLNGVLDECEPLLAVDVNGDATPDVCQGAYVAEADTNATVQVGGVRATPNGLAFFNIEGAALTTNASYGGVRFDLTDLVAQFDGQFGAGNWHVDSAYVRVVHANAAFTAAGDVSILHSNNDAADLTPGGAQHPPIYADFASDFGDGLEALTYSFAVGATGDVENHKVFDAAGTNLSGGDAIAGEINSGSGPVTLLFREVTDTVAATYAGITNNANLGPTLVVFAAEGGVGPSCPPCAADYDNNGGVDGGDLGAFFADFEAGETCADVDQNGGVDGGDLGYFFTVFEAGGC